MMPIRSRGPAVLPELHMHQTKVRAGLKRAVEKVEAGGFEWLVPGCSTGLYRPLGLPQRSC